MIGNQTGRVLTQQELIAMDEPSLLELGQKWEDQARLTLATPVDRSETAKIDFLRKTVYFCCEQAVRCYAAVGAKQATPEQLFNTMQAAMK